MNDDKIIQILDKIDRIEERVRELISELKDKNVRIDELEDEISRLKQGIKTVETTMIVDGGDMYDHGWTSSENVSKGIYKAAKKFGIPGWELFNEIRQS